MKKSNYALKIIISVVLVAVLCTALVACDNTETQYVTAYDIAVKNGFVGTEQEWLDSLKGTDGTDGVDGKNGLNGKDGEDADGVTYIKDLYAAAQENGYTGTFLDFLEDYLTVNVSKDNVYAVSKAIKSAVTIVSKFTKTERYYSFGGKVETKETSYSAGGAGVIYKMDTDGNAYVITNFHVVYDSDSNQTDHISEDIGLYLYGGETESGKIEASFVGGSAYYDIAVLRVTESEVLKNSCATAVSVSENAITVGQTAMAIGFPEGEGMSVTSGIVSVDSERISVKVDGDNAYQLRVLRIDTAVNSGNSGGGLFDSDGNLIGIVNAKTSSSSTENISYAIPKEIAIGVAKNVIANCTDSNKRSVYKCLIGITAKTSESKAVYDEETGLTRIRETVTVDSVEENGLAYGKLESGDILLTATFNEKTVDIDRSFTLSDMLLEAKVGDSVTISFSRNGEEKTVTLTFTENDVTEYFVA